MKNNTRSWILRRAIAVSVLLNAVMALCGTVANLVRPLSWLSIVSRAIATPPSLILRHLVSLHGVSLAGVISIELEAVAFSLLFYALVAGVVLRLVNRRETKA
jgi:hypothetical protein